MINHAQCSHCMAGRRDQRRTRIKAQMKIPGHQRIVRKARILRGIGHGQHVMLIEDCMRTERHVPGSFDVLHTDTRLEPLPLAIDQTDQHDRRLEDMPRNPGQILERFFGQRIEDVVGAQSSQALQFIRRDGCGRHSDRIRIISDATLKRIETRLSRVRDNRGKNPIAGARVSDSLQTAAAQNRRRSTRQLSGAPRQQPLLWRRPALLPAAASIPPADNADSRRGRHRRAKSHRARPARTRRTRCAAKRGRG